MRAEQTQSAKPKASMELNVRASDENPPLQRRSRKWWVLQDSMGIPYLNQTKTELLEDLATLDRVMGAV
jgi:hypothetical protein